MTFDTDALNEPYPARVTLEIGNMAATVMLVLMQEDGVTQDRVLALIDDMVKMSAISSVGFLSSEDFGAVQHFVSIIKRTIESGLRPPSPWVHL